MQDVCLAAKGITKNYPGTVALDNVDFNVYCGKVNALVGENGAGKSTLMKIISGIEKADSGKIYLNGEEVIFLNTREAMNKGIGIIHQELNLFENLTVAQNLFITKENVKHGFILDQESHYKKANEVFKRLKQDIRPDAKVGSLRAGQQQIVEIARTLLQQNLCVLIMDEPTSSLSTSEVEVLFGIIDDLKKAGISIIYISHRLEEVMQIGDYVTVLRDGKKIDEAQIDKISTSWIIEKMLGYDILQVDITHQVQNEEVLRVDSLTLPRSEGGFAVNHVSFSLKKGEVLGIYGLLGAGRTELLETMIGLHPEVENYLYIEGYRYLIKSVSEQIKNGLALVPENRKIEGLIPVLSTRVNITLSSLKRYIKYYCLIDEYLVDKAVNKMIHELAIKLADSRLPVEYLSGGNQQKVVIGKAVLTLPKVLLLDEPTRGIDVGAKEDVYKIIDGLANQGLGIIFVTSELKEILAVADRVIVMSNGEITGEFQGEEITEEALVAASSVGHSVRNNIG